MTLAAKQLNGLPNRLRRLSALEAADTKESPEVAGRAVAARDIRLHVVIHRSPRQVGRDLGMRRPLDHHDVCAVHVLREEVLTMIPGEVGVPPWAPVRGL